MSLKFRIAAVIFALEAIMIGVVLWVTNDYAIQSYDTQIQVREQAALDIIGNIGRVALLDGNFDRIQTHIAALTKNPGILQATLADEHNIIVASNRLVDIGQTLPTLSDTPTAHWSTISIDQPPDRLGQLAVQFSDQTRLATYRETLHRGIVIAAAGMTLIAVFGIGFGYLLTRRLDRLAHAAERISQGDYTVRTALRGRDEVAKVSNAIDNMTRVIAAERDALAEINRALDQRVAARTRELEELNREHRAFAYAISHDLRAPLRALSGFAQALGEDYTEQLDDTARDYLQRIEKSSQTMGELIEGLLKLSRINQVDISQESLDLSALSHELVDELRAHEPQRAVTVDIQPDIHGEGDRQLLRDALANLIGNAWKFTARVAQPRIRIGSDSYDSTTVYYVRDNGAGFDPAYTNKLFVPFQRLHHAGKFSGAGIGLSTVRRIIQRHGGAVWAEGREGKGSTFYFTLHNPRPDTQPSPAGSTEQSGCRAN